MDGPRQAVGAVARGAVLPILGAERQSGARCTASVPARLGVTRSHHTRENRLPGATRRLKKRGRGIEYTSTRLPCGRPHTGLAGSVRLWSESGFSGPILCGYCGLKQGKGVHPPVNKLTG